MYIFNGQTFNNLGRYFGQDDENGRKKSKHHRKKHSNQQLRPGNIEPAVMPKPPEPVTIPVNNSPIPALPLTSEALPTGIQTATGYSQPSLPQQSISPTNVAQTITPPPVMPFLIAAPLRAPSRAAPPVNSSAAPSVSINLPTIQALLPTAVTPQQARVGAASTAAALALLLI